MSRPKPKPARPPKNLLQRATKIAEKLQRKYNVVVDGTGSRPVVVAHWSLDK